MIICKKSSPQEQYLYEIECDCDTSIVKQETADHGVETKSTWKIGNIKPTYKITEHTIITQYELDPTDDYYLVTAVWSDNDDWNKFTNNKINFLMICKDYNSALKLSESISTHHKKSLTSTSENNNVTLEERFFFEYIDELGNQKKIHTPWNAYFKELNKVDVERVKFFNEKNNKYKNRL